jgi:hypothetical protein
MAHILALQTLAVPIDNDEAKLSSLLSVGCC